MIFLASAGQSTSTKWPVQKFLRRTTLSLRPPPKTSSWALGALRPARRGAAWPHGVPRGLTAPVADSPGADAPAADSPGADSPGADSSK